MLFGFFAISSGVPSATIPIRFLYQAYIYISTVSIVGMTEFDTMVRKNQ